MQNIQPAHIERFLNQMLTSGRKDGSGGLAPNTVKIMDTIIASALNDAVERGELQQSPMSAFRKIADRRVSDMTSSL